MLKKIKPTDFDTVFSIMERSFPKDEYRPYDAQRALLADERYSIYVTENIEAFSAVWQFEGFAFIEHLAVDPDCRCGGLGTRVLSELKSLLGCRLCLEVELPETEIAKRRVGFYERNGFTLSHFGYMQPPLAKGQGSLPLKIMTTDGGITESEFSHIRAELYKYVYKTDI